MGITDGDHVCNLCGNYQTCCSLCIGDPNQRVVYIGDVNRRKEQTDREAERELDQQSRSIRDAAERRRQDG